MKKILLGALSTALMAMSVNAFADKIIIKGAPTPVVMQDNVYVVDKASTSGYYYVTVDSKNKVCYTEKNPALVSLQVLPISMKIGSETHSVYCYDVDPTYFVVEEVH